MSTSSLRTTISTCYLVLYLIVLSSLFLPPSSLSFYLWQYTGLTPLNLSLAAGQVGIIVWNIVWLQRNKKTATRSELTKTKILITVSSMLVGIILLFVAFLAYIFTHMPGGF